MAANLRNSSTSGNPATLITECLDIWTSADSVKKSGRGRSSGNPTSVYGIKKLRELILELAVRGKLVPQNPKDEPASELLKRIQTEREKLIRTGMIKKMAQLPAVTEVEKQFELPAGWEWSRLNDFVLSIQSGGTPSKTHSEFWNGKIPWASVKDLNVEKFLTETQDLITQKGLESGSKLANAGDLLICTRMGLGKIAIAAMDVAINQDLKALKITSLLDVDYFIKFYKTLKIAGSGMTVAGIKQDELLGFCIPTPPFTEQHRIVAKVDELMALCDQLEAQHNNAAEAHEKIVSVLLETLIQSTDAKAFTENWQRIATHFDTLFTTETSIDALKQTLLQLAVMGKLVQPDPNDETADELLKKIASEKAQLIKKGKIKKEKPLPEISDEDISFNSPHGWAWSRMGDLALFQKGHAFKSEGYLDSGLMITKIQNLSENHIENSVYIAQDRASEFSQYLLFEGDIVMTTVGSWFSAPLSAVGRSFLINRLFDNSLLNQNAVRIRFWKKLDPMYLLTYLKSSIFKSYLVQEAQGTANQASITQESIKNFLLCIPPKEEQHRIVAKVDELMTLCDQLKLRINDANQCQQKLADVMIEKAVA